MFPVLASHVEQSVTLLLKATPQNDHVLLEIEGANGATVAVELSRHQTAALILTLGQAVQALPPDPTEPLHLQGAVLHAIDPSFQVGLAPSGNVLLAIKPGPFPSLEFEFEAHLLSKLISDLRSAANVPVHPQGKPS